MPSPPERALAGLALACCLALGAGCDSDDGPGPALASDNGPWASLGQFAVLSQDSPARAARRYVLQVSVGASPFAVAQLAPEVASAVGRRHMVRALELAAVPLLGVSARSRTAARRGALARVEVRVGQESESPQLLQFALVRRQGRWFVAYDSLTRRALSSSAPRRVLRRYVEAGHAAAGAA